MSKLHRYKLFLSATLVATALTACSPSAATDSTQPPTAANSVTVENAWVKASDGEMTPGFATLVNTSETQVDIVSVQTEAATSSELHETVQDASGAMVMRKIEGGFQIPAGQEFALEPAGNHLMLMELAQPLSPGQDVTFTLEFSDGSEMEFDAVVKDYAAANENYVPAPED